MIWDAYINNIAKACYLILMESCITFYKELLSRVSCSNYIICCFMVYNFILRTLICKLLH